MLFLLVSNHDYTFQLGMLLFYFTYVLTRLNDLEKLIKNYLFNQILNKNKQIRDNQKQSKGIVELLDSMYKLQPNKETFKNNDRVGIIPQIKNNFYIK